MKGSKKFYFFLPILVQSFFFFYKCQQQHSIIVFVFFALPFFYLVSNNNLLENYDPCHHWDHDQNNGAHQNDGHTVEGVLKVGTWAQDQGGVVTSFQLIQDLGETGIILTILFVLEDLGWFRWGRKVEERWWGRQEAAAFATVTFKPRVFVHDWLKRRREENIIIAYARFLFYSILTKSLERFSSLGHSWILRLSWR